MSDKILCKGCATYVVQTITTSNEVIIDIPCDIDVESGGKQCPCLTCIVKAICDIPCELITDYIACSKLLKIEDIPNE